MISLPDECPLDPPGDPSGVPGWHREKNNFAPCPKTDRIDVDSAKKSKGIAKINRHIYEEI